MMIPTVVNVEFPFGVGKIDILADEPQQLAAWKLYVEFVTRITVQALDDDKGLIREAFTSIYKMFDITRDVLKEGGPRIAHSKNSIGIVSIKMLNQGLRPFLTTWHPILKDYEDKRPAEVGALEHEMAWEHYTKVRAELKALQADLGVFVAGLATIASIEHE